MKNKTALTNVFRPIPALAGAGQPGVFRWPLLLAAGSGDSDSGGKRTIRVGRRRRSGPEGSEDRQRAETPQRRRESPPQRPGGDGGARPPIFSGGQISGGKGRPPSMMMIGALVVLFLCVLLVMFFLGSGDSGNGDTYPPPEDSGSTGYVQPETSGLEPLEPVVQEQPTLPPEPFTPPPVSSNGQTWLVMLYQDADDKVLEQDIYLDLNEAERVGSSDRVHIVAQVDRYRAGYQGDGDWTSTKRFYITQDSDLQRVSSQLVADLGEVNMADGQALVDFVTWAVENFPADRHVLIMSDHGMGWPGGWTDPAPGGRGDPSIPLSGALGDVLYLSELDDALAQIRAQTGLEQFELIGMDACLMGHLEVFSALAPHARYAVASQEVEPALGWAYTGFLEMLKANPDMTGTTLSQLIVDSYIQDDQRIVDDQARAEFLSKGSPMGGLFSLLGGGGGGMSAEQLARQMEQNVTLTAVDLAAIPELVDSVNDLAFILQQAQQPVVAQARTYAQSFTSIFGSNVPPSYIDLGNFVQLLARESNNGQVTQAANQVLTSLNKAVIAEKHGPKKAGATGISIYFPNSQLYRSPVTGPESYTVIARRFADASLWDDFLAYHYTGRPFERAAGELAVPQRGTTISGPGAGRIETSPLSLSDRVAAPGRPILLSTDISGQNLGYVYLFVGFYDQASNSILVADTDYLESDTTREVDGVYYPDWGEGGEFTMEFEWEPLVFAVSNGMDSVAALFAPQSYGASFEEAI
ncbi:MAG: hypothetical protein JXM69_09330, partial [Anaerolineae bacterium]|nr:hypothetical protein [Anaerolineae bacterium]